MTFLLVGRSMTVPDTGENEIFFHRRKIWNTLRIIVVMVLMFLSFFFLLRLFIAHVGTIVYGRCRHKGWNEFIGETNYFFLVQRTRGTFTLFTLFNASQVEARLVLCLAVSKSKRLRK